MFVRLYLEREVQKYTGKVSSEIGECRVMRESVREAVLNL